MKNDLVFVAGLCRNWVFYPKLLQAETRAICYEAVFLFLSSVVMAPLLLNYLAVNQDIAMQNYLLTNRGCVFNQRTHKGIITQRKRSQDRHSSECEVTKYLMVGPLIHRCQTLWPAA